MNPLVFMLFLSIVMYSPMYAQQIAKDDAKQAILKVVDQYSEAREKQDTVLLKAILTDDVDQLVSTGEWRVGRSAGIQGMLRSSSSNPGDRTIVVDRIRLLNKKAAVADARYEISEAGGESRKMWSTFMLVREGKLWKIAGIRNMLPRGN